MSTPILPTERLSGNFLGVHVLRQTTGVNLNAGHDGTPKTLSLGNVTRERVSSQSRKRAVRRFMRNALEAADQAYTTRYMPKGVTEALFSSPDLPAGTNWREALLRSGALLSLIEYSPELAHPERMSTSRTETHGFVTALAGLVLEHWDTLSEAAAQIDAASTAFRAVEDNRELSTKEKNAELKKLPAKHKAVVSTDSKQKKHAVKLDKAVFPEVWALSGAVETARRLSTNLEIAVNGRFAADTQRQGNVLSAVGFAHAHSVDAVQSIIDFQANADDFAEGGFGEEVEGSEKAENGHIRTQVYVTGCLYEYTVIDRAQLRANLKKMGDADLDERVALAERVLVDALVRAVPTGQTNSTAGANSPAQFALALATDAQPLTASSAFTTPVGDLSRVAEDAAERLAEFAAQTDVISPAEGVYRWLAPTGAQRPELDFGAANIVEA